MAYLGPVRRWEVYWADLGIAIGHEMKGERRLVIVVSNDGFNRSFGVITIIPITKAEGKTRKKYPFEVFLPKGIAGNVVDSLAQPFQIRTIDKVRLLEAPVGRLSDEDLRVEVEDKLLEHLGITIDSED